MAVTITHQKVSSVPDGSDTDVVRPSDWNADHTVAGLGTAAEADATDFATAAQGAKADTALQAADIGVSVQAYDADLTAWAGVDPSSYSTTAEIASAYQPLDSDLTAIAALTTTSFGRGLLELANAGALLTAGGVSAFIQTLMDDADAATARSTLGLVIGTNVQAYDADLTTWASLTPSANAQSLVTAADYSAMRTLLSLVPGTNVQAYDADLAALAANSTDGLWAHTGAGAGAARTLTAPAAGISISNPAGIAGNPTFALANDLSAVEGLASNGMAARTATDTWAVRTITGTSAQITVTNGDGVSGNPTLSLPSDVLIPTVLTVPNTGLHILDSNASHDLIVKPGSNITADRTLTVTTGDTDITIDLTDAGSDKLMFWDDSAGAWTALTLGTNLSITGTTIDAASGGGPTVGTAQATTSGSTITFSSLPSTVKQITLSWTDGSTNGTGAIGIQLGDSGGLETSGYSGMTSSTANGAASGTSWSTQALLAASISASGLMNFVATITLVNTNTWSISISGSSTSGSFFTHAGAGNKTLTGTLDRVALLTANTFDAGSVNIAYV